MKIYDLNRTDNKNLSYDLTLNLLEQCNVIDDYSLYLMNLSTNHENTCNFKISEILEYFNELSKYIITQTSCTFTSEFSNYGASFIINFLRKDNLDKLLRIALNNNIEVLDRFQKDHILNKFIMAHPKGIVTHWLAGNVPVLGMISLVQGILTKNINIIKLPSRNGLILPNMINILKEFNCKVDNKEIKGIDIFASTSFVYCDKDDIDAQNELSKNSDIRIAWGGKDAVERVMTLPRKFGTEDIIFGPKYSFVYIDNTLKIEKLKDITYKLSLDVSIFEQQGCNSPHTVFIQNDGEVNLDDFCNQLASSMDEVLKRLPKHKVSPSESLSVINTRTKYAFDARVITSNGSEWTIIISDEDGLADACYSRTIFVKSVTEIKQVIKVVQKNKHQTLGLFLNPDKKLDFARQITSKGIERITDIGQMSAFTYPWDGMFPINRLIRWASLNNFDGKNE